MGHGLPQGGFFRAVPCSVFLRALNRRGCFPSPLPQRSYPWVDPRSLFRALFLQWFFACNLPQRLFSITSFVLRASSALTAARLLPRVLSRGHLLCPLLQGLFQCAFSRGLFGALSPQFSLCISSRSF